MSKLKNILKAKNIELFQNDRLSLDNYYLEPFQDRNETFEENVQFETSPPKNTKRLEANGINLFKYFLDGSRKPYKIGDIITRDSKFAPLVAAQVGAICCERDAGLKIHLYKLLSKNMLVFIDRINEQDLEEIHKEFKMSKGIPVEIDTYKFEKQKDDAPTNAAVAKIHKTMQDMEIQLLTSIVEEDRRLSTDKMMVIDGSLQFLTQKFNPMIFYNVIGISKTYNPNLSGLLKGNKHIGVMLAHLKMGERTSVFKLKTGRYSFGAWYIRIRPQNHVKDPLEGVIKIEKMAMKEDEDNGFETSVIDNISASVLTEINPTCHGNDSRWANHIYPIYLTEKRLKASFFSDSHFMNIF